MRWILVSCAALAVAAALPGHAQTIDVAPDAAPPQVALLSPEDLTAATGAGVEAIALAEQQLQATNTGNTITAGVLQNGDIAFDAGALNGFAGVGSFLANTGNNSNLQGSISITIVSAAPSP